VADVVGVAGERPRLAAPDVEDEEVVDPAAFREVIELAGVRPGEEGLDVVPLVGGDAARRRGPVLLDVEVPVAGPVVVALGEVRLSEGVGEGRAPRGG